MLIKLSFEQFEELHKKNPKKYDQIFERAGFGIDTISYSEMIDISDCNTLLDTLILNINSIDVLKEIMSKTILPFSNQYVNEIDLKYNNYAESMP
jgi:hypothetical protein